MEISNHSHKLQLTFTDFGPQFYFYNMARKKTNKSNKRGQQQSKYSGIKSAVAQGLREGAAAIGGALGGAPGAALGRAAGALISRVTGFGDYTIRGNSILNGKQFTFGNDSRKDRTQHHEYLGDITASTNFTVRNFMLNPGVQGVFNWATIKARAYQQWRLRGCVFYFRSTSAEWSGDGQGLGTVIMGTNYDVTRPNFSSKVEMENYLFSNSGKPSEHFIHPIECDPLETPNKILYIREGPLRQDQDPKYYDFANFQIAVVGCNNSVEGNTLGELWVAYDIEFLKPQYPPGGVNPGQYFSRINYIPASSAVLGPIQDVGDTFGNLDLRVSGGTLTWPSTISGGRFFVQISWMGGSSLPEPAVPTVEYENMSAVRWFGSDSADGRSLYYIAASNGEDDSEVSSYIQTFVGVVDVNGYDPSGSSLVFSPGIDFHDMESVNINVICISSVERW